MYNYNIIFNFSNQKKFLYFNLVYPHNLKIRGEKRNFPDFDSASNDIKGNENVFRLEELKIFQSPDRYMVKVIIRKHVGNISSLVAMMPFEYEEIHSKVNYSSKDAFLKPILDMFTKNGYDLLENK